jgi:hypothetical protein
VRREAGSLDDLVADKSSVARLSYGDDDSSQNAEGGHDERDWRVNYEKYQYP